MGKKLSAAFFYLTLGWSVIPIRANDKRPAISSWQEYQTRRATKEELEGWFADDTLNLGLVCGEISGVAVVDDDSYKTQGGQVALKSTLSVKSPKGGRHYYFKCPQDLRPSVNEKIAVDIRANGSYVLLPPSSINGSEYEWVSRSQKNFQNLPELPQELLEQIVPQNEYNGRIDLSQYLNMSEGGRNDGLYRALCSLLNRIQDDKREEEGLMLATGINSNYNPPLPESEVLKTLEQAIRFVRNNPATKPEFSLRSENLTQFSDRSENLLSREDRLVKVKQIFKEGYKEGLPTGFTSLDKIIHGLQSGQSYLIFADTNVGKSVFALNILINLAKSNTPSMYFDLENSADLTHERMILINDSKLTKEGFDQLQKEKNLDGYLDDISRLPIDSWSLDEISERFGSITYDAIEGLIMEGIKNGTRVFCIDHLHYFEPSETDYSKLGDIARKLNTLAAKEHVTIIFVAHTKKGLSSEKDGKVIARRPTLEDVSGSKLIVAHTKNVISLKRNEQADDPAEKVATTVIVNKQKTGPTGRFDLTFNPQKLTFRDPFSYSSTPKQKDDVVLPKKAMEVTPWYV